MKKIHFVFGLVNFLIIQITLITTSVLVINQHSNAWKDSIMILYILLTITSLINVFVNVILLIKLFNEKEFTVNDWIISLIGLNIYSLIIVTIREPENFKSYFKNTFPRIKTTDITYMAIALAFFYISLYAEGFIPSLPFFLTVSLEFLSLFFLAITTSFVPLLLTIIIVVSTMWIFPAVNSLILSPWTYLFDYVFPTFAYLVCAFAQKKHLSSFIDKLIFLTIFIVVPLLIAWFSWTISGVLFWSDGAWTGFGDTNFGIFIFSLSYNAMQAFFDIATFMFVVPPMYFAIIKIKNPNYYQLSKTEIKPTENITTEIEQ